MGTLAEAMAPSTRSTGPAAGPGAGVRASDSTMVPSSDTKRRTPARSAVTASRSCRPGRATSAGSTARTPSSLPWRSALGQRVEVEDGAAAGAQVAPDPGQPEPGPGDQAGEMALAPAPGAPGLPPPLAVRGAGRHHLVARQDGGGREGEGGAGALGDLLVDLAAQCGAVERPEPVLLAEHVLGLGPGQHVALDLVDPVRELRERAGLGQDRGGDGPGGGGGDDVGGDPLHAHQVLEDTDLEGSLGAAAGQDEARYGVIG